MIPHYTVLENFYVHYAAELTTLVAMFFEGLIICFSMGAAVCQFSFPGFGGSDANSIGGGSAMFGNIFTQNTGFTQSNPSGSMGLAQGSAMGSGQGINVYNAANSQSGFGRRKRQSGFGGFGSLANSLGGGSAMLGNIFTQNTGFTQSNPFGSMGLAQGSAMGSGQGINVFNAANSQSGFGRR